MDTHLDKDRFVTAPKEDDSTNVVKNMTELMARRKDVCPTCLQPLPLKDEGAQEEPLWQEQLWEEVIEITTDTYERSGFPDVIEELKSKYTITRKALTKRQNET